MRLSVLGEGKTMEFNKLIAIPAIALAASLGLAACGSGAAGYNNVSTLDHALTQSSAWPSGPGSSGLPTSAICVHQSGTQYACGLEFSDNSTQDISLTVASDGQSFTENPGN
jgi:hypothetical protein